MEFIQLCANIFTANDIKVYLFESLRPTPELSFAVRHLGCDTGIVLTASHNPPEYNGYKVYNNEGAQIVPPEDGHIISEINSVSFDSIKFEANTDLLEVIGSEVDKAFIEAAVKNGTFGKKDRSKLKIVFTSLHGTSIKIIPDALKAAGYSNVHIVEEQRVPDGDFPTVKSPNPEEPAALKMATELAEEIDADIVIGTDPDSDRIGIAVRGLDGKMTLLNGNQTMTLMSNYLIQQWKKAKKINGKQFIGSTIVSTNLVRDIALANDVACKIGLTGFKWIAKMIHDHKDLEFIGGGEESFGYMVGDFVRDKDAVTAALLACEIATEAKENGKTLLEELIAIYIDYDFYKEHLISVVKKGMQGQEIIKKMMLQFRENPPRAIDKSKVVYIEDYAKSERLNLITGVTETITVCSGSNYTYPDGTVETSVTATTSHVSNLQTAVAGCDSIIETTLTIGQTYNLTETINTAQYFMTKWKFVLMKTVIVSIRWTQKSSIPTASTMPLAIKSIYMLTEILS